MICPFRKSFATTLTIAWVDVHEGTSWHTCCGFYIVAVRINRFILVCFVDLCAEVLFADG
jgi:thiosulfate reductase cytochrome b subunit